MPEFFILLLLAIALSYISIINKPFTIIETFFHEFSHGLASVITFGKIKKIVLNIDGSGVCHTQGGWSHLILVSGYLGAAAFGLFIYCVGTLVQNNIEQAQTFLYSIIIAFIFITLMWVRDLKTLMCMFMIGSIFYFPLNHQLYQYTAIFLKFIGIYVCLSAIKAPLYLIDGKSVGDGADLFKITLIPEFVWIGLWVAFASYCMYIIYLISNGIKIFGSLI
jgi:hypothetical protein